MQEFLAGNKCNGAYKNTDLCIWYELWAYKRVERTPWLTQLWYRSFEMILHGMTNATEVFGCEDCVSNIRLYATPAYPKSGAHFLPTRWPEPSPQHGLFIRSRRDRNAIGPKGKLPKEFSTPLAGTPPPVQLFCMSSSHVGNEVHGGWFLFFFFPIDLCMTSDLGAILETHWI